MVRPVLLVAATLAASGAIACGGDSPTAPLEASCPTVGIVVNTNVSGSLGARDCRLVELYSDGGRMYSDTVFYRKHAFNVEPGKVHLARLVSEDFDAVLTLYAGDAGIMEDIAGDDDGGGGTNSEVFFVPASSERHIIHARGYAQGDTGAYTLRVSTCERRPVSPGQPVGGSLTSSDCMLRSVTDDDSSFVDFYAVTFAQSETRTITVASSAFRPNLAIGGPREDFWETGWSAASETDTTQLTFTAGEAGTYLLVVAESAFGPGGTYSVSVSAPVAAASSARQSASSAVRARRSAWYPGAGRIKPMK